MAGPVTSWWLFCWWLYKHFPKLCCRPALLHVSLSPRPVWLLIAATAYMEVINLAEQDSITGKWKQTTGVCDSLIIQGKLEGFRSFFNLNLNFAFLACLKGCFIQFCQDSYIVMSFQTDRTAANWNVILFFRAGCQNWYPESTGFRFTTSWFGLIPISIQIHLHLLDLFHFLYIIYTVQKFGGGNICLMFLK